MLSLQEPANFRPKFEVVSCFIKDGERFLMLHRTDGEDEGDRWGVPAGKVEKGETLLDAILREAFEETGIGIGKMNIRYWGKTFVRYPDYDFIYHVYSTVLPESRGVKINEKEHKDFRWVTPEEALKMPLIRDEEMSIKLFYGLKE